VRRPPSRRASSKAEYLFPEPAFGEQVSIDAVRPLASHLCRNRGNDGEARDLLAPFYGRCPDGLDTRGLRVTLLTLPSTGCAGDATFRIEAIAATIATFGVGFLCAEDGRQMFGAPKVDELMSAAMHISR
jgi:hypothetical protein